MKVLPVPALASRTVTPVGSGPQTSNGRMSVVTAHRSKTASVREQAVPQARGVAAEARRLGVVPAVALLVGARRLGDQLVEADDAAEDELVLELGVLLGEVPARLPRVARPAFSASAPAWAALA